MDKSYLRDDLLLEEATGAAFSLEIYRLYAFRARNFLKELLIALDENVTGWVHIIDEATKFSVQLIYLKREIGATLNEIALSAFWHVLQIRGINKFNVNKLIKIARDKLRRRVLYKRVLRILSRIRLIELNFSVYREVANIILTTIPKLINDKGLVSKSRYVTGSVKAFYYMENLRRIAIRIANEIPQKLISGKSRRVIAAICIYVSDKLLAERYGIKPILSARILEKHLGVSQFTILRRYKTLYKEIINMGILDE